MIPARHGGGHREGEGGGASEPASRRRIRDALFQVIGFALGILFIAWCFRRAFSGDGFASVSEHIRNAPTRLIVAALFATLVSVVANGTIFWCSNE